MVRVLLVDDHEFVRHAIAVLLAQAGGIEVVGECADGSDVVAVTDSTQPDVVLMDVQMPGVGGIEATRLVTAARPGTKVLILAATMTPSTVEEAERAGAMGYLLKGGTPEELVEGIRQVAAGHTLWGLHKPADHDIHPANGN